LHGQAIALDAGDPNPFAGGGWAAPRAPFAVTDANTATVFIDLLNDGHHFSDQASRPVVQERVGAVGVAVRIEAPPDEDREQGIKREQRELGHRGEPEQDGEEARRDCRGADEHEEEAGRDDFHDQQQDAADQPQPPGIEVNSVHDLLSGTPGTAFARTPGTSLPLPSPNASLANSPIPPSVPIN